MAKGATLEVVSEYRGRGVIRRLKNSKNFFMRFRFFEQKGWTPWRKTGTADLQTASRIASDEYQRIRGLIKTGGIKMNVSRFYDDLTVVGAATRWLTMYKLKAEARQSLNGKGRPASLAQYEDYKILIERYVTGFFGRKKKLTEVTMEDIYAYMKWRETYYTEGPGSQVDTIDVQRNGKTYRRKALRIKTQMRSGELGVLKSIFEFAAKEGLITRQQIPEIPNAKKTTKQIEESRFPAFSEEHWRIIENKIDEWTETPYKNAKKARVAFRYYLLIMAEIGLRATNEHAKLKWRHVVFQDHKGQEVVDIHVPSKTKTGHRVVSVGPHGAKLLRDWKKLTVYGEPNDPVFANPANGQPVLRYTSAFAKFLKFAGIEHSEDEKSYVPSSTRHSFCSRLREAGLPDQLIARLMGHSSTDMIQRHYGQDLLSAHRDRIVEADNKRRKPKQDLTHLAGAVSSAPNTPRGLALHESDDDGPRIIMTKRGLVAK